jgi:hypothetical protein
MTKVCSHCREDKPLEGFGESSRYRFGRHYLCLSCRQNYLKQRYELTADHKRDYGRKYYHANKDRYKASSEKRKDKVKISLRKHHLFTTYGLTISQYDKMYLDQVGLCAVCHDPFGNASPCVDHDHSTGKPRGLVHRGCNNILGFCKDSVEHLQFAIEYLERSKSWQTLSA